MDLNASRSSHPSSASPRQRFYALFDNGDWTEMGSVPAGQPGDAVWFVTVEEDDDDVLYDRAGMRDGTVVGAVTIIDGSPVLHPASELPTTLADHPYGPPS